MKPEIKAIIVRDFTPEEATEIEHEVEKLNARNFKVGTEQFIRSLLYLSNG
jgi:hypothetical protein